MSIWIIERVFVLNKPIPLAMVPFVDRKMADDEVAKLHRIYGGDYRVVEYRRVEATT